MNKLLSRMGVTFSGSISGVSITNRLTGVLKVFHEALWGFCCVFDSWFPLVYRTEAPLGQFSYRFLFLQTYSWCVSVCVVWVHMCVLTSNILLSSLTLCYT